MTLKILRTKILPHTVLIVFSVFFLFPFVWLLFTSLKTSNEIFALPPRILPEAFHWENYKAALETVPFPRYMWNTLVICVICIIGQLFAAPLVAYSISRIPWVGSKIIFAIVLATMILPSQVQMIPQYIIFTKLGWVNTILPLTIGAFFGAPFYIFLLRQFLLGVPKELSEAAKIDGASEFRIYTQIILPTLKPALATVALFTFVGSYTDFMGPLIYLNDAAKWTITVGLQGFQQDHGAQWEQLMAASTIMAIPMILLYFFGQKYFMQSGSAFTGFK
ncbi:sugar ABC transporter permease [Paenibacillus selenitireducens]|jgi:multiple sugar transport system permease protein|uniref:Sugar ABC transporter permease n=1 Tax=Paenibacillus selenitireducens TaxID=1324314 RepID=A0A1T2X2W8_9BACL|nr:carbohydrate ABC transporter permease [Paenibacillus selenitireducens]OPA74202.1 sugar ABC transporter permease [Paenibacillus selenitireducens]